MQNPQRDALNSYNRIQDFNKEHNTTLSLISDYADVRTLFNTEVAAIREALNIQIHRPDNHPMFIHQHKINMAETVHQYASKAFVKASLLQIAELQQMLDFPITYISQANKSEAVAKAESALKIIKDNLSILTNIAPDDITIIENAINQYNRLKDDPTIQIQSKKAYGTDVIPTAIRKANRYVKLMFRLLRSEYKTSAPELLDEFKLAKHIIPTGLIHTKIQFTILLSQTDTPVTGATVHDLKYQRDYQPEYPDSNIIKIPKHRAGEFKFTVTTPLHHPQTVLHHVKPRRLNSFIVHLSPAFGTISGTILHLGAPLPNAVITIQGTSLITTSDALGFYTIPRIPIGNHTASARLSDSNLLQNQAITIKPDTTIPIDFNF